MKKIYLILTLLMGFTSNIQAQKPSEKEKDIYYDFIYHFSKETFATPKKYVYKKKKYNEKELFPKIENTEELTVITDSLKSFASLNFKENNVYLKSKFPSFFDPKTNFESDVIDIEVLNYNLTNAKNTKIELHKGGGLGFGFSYYYQNKNEEEKQLNFITVNKQSQIKNDNQFILPIKGNITYLVKYTTGYNKVELSHKDIGKTFIINKKIYTLNQIKDNKIFIKFNEKDNIKIILFDEKNKDILIPKTLTDTLYDEEPLVITQTIITEKIYNIFNENPDIGIEEFKKKINFEELLNENTPKYLVISLPAPIKNKFILYSPILVTKPMTVYTINNH